MESRDFYYQKWIENMWKISNQITGQIWVFKVDMCPNSTFNLPYISTKFHISKCPKKWIYNCLVPIVPKFQLNLPSVALWKLISKKWAMKSASDGIVKSITSLQLVQSGTSVKKHFDFTRYGIKSVKKNNFSPLSYPKLLHKLSRYRYKEKDVYHQII